MTPRITVLLPMHNNAATVAATIESVLAQTFSDFEFLIIDDASTDAGTEIVRGYGDERIRLVRNDERLELTRTLNKGISLARGSYIARIDADDLCLPARLAKQVEFLDAHPDIAVAGTFIETFSEDALGEREVIRYPAEPASVAAALAFRCTLAHPTVMLRTTMFEAHGPQGIHYNESFRRAQDYELWARCAIRGMLLANVPEVLVQYRVHEQQATRKYAAESLAAGGAVRLSILRAMGMDPSAREHALHERLSVERYEATAEFVGEASDWLCRLAAANQGRALFSPEAFLRVLTGRFVGLYRFAHGAGLPLPEIGRTPLEPFLDRGALD